MANRVVKGVRREEMMEEKGTLPYCEDTTREWVDAVVAMPWQEVSRGAEKLWVLSAPCPRCGHLMSTELEVLVVVLQDGHQAKMPEEVFVGCNCASPHDGRPEGKRGCGYAAVIPGPIAGR